MDPIERVGIRNLRQNLSVYIKKVLEGQTFEVTDHGQAVAILAPLPEPASVLDHLIATGRATKAKGLISELGPPIGEPSTLAGQALQELREERL